MNIVVAFNETPAAHAATEWAAEVAKHAGGQVHLVSAVSPPKIPAHASPHVVEELMGAAMAAAQKQVDTAVAELSRRGIDVRGHVRRWLTVDTVIDRAKETGAQLIVVGRRGSTRATELLIGTVSSELVRLSPVSVLVVPHEAAVRPGGSVLVGVDGSPHSLRAIKVARQVFPDSQLVLCHVEHGKAGPGEDLLRKAAAEAGVDPKTVRMLVRHGDPAHELLDELGKGDYKSIVQGPRGLGLLKGLLLGSVTEKVLQLAALPILVAR